MQAMRRFVGIGVNKFTETLLLKVIERAQALLPYVQQPISLEESNEETEQEQVVEAIAAPLVHQEPMMVEFLSFIWKGSIGFTNYHLESYVGRRNVNFKPMESPHFFFEFSHGEYHLKVSATTPIEDEQSFCNYSYRGWIEEGNCQSQCETLHDRIYSCC